VEKVVKWQKCIQLFTLFTTISIFVGKKKMTGYLPFTLKVAKLRIS